jgi:ferritin
MNEKVLNLLNGQIWLENRASFYYLNLSILCDVNGYSGAAKFFRKQSEEERYHMLKICDFLLGCDKKPSIPTNTFLEDKYEEFNLIRIFEDSLFNEKEITNTFNELLIECRVSNDFNTENFIQWFICEQREEENKFKSLIDQLRIIGNNESGLYQFDLNVKNL